MCNQCVKNQFKKKKSSIPSPPTIYVPEASISVDNSSSHKRYIIEDSSSNEKLKAGRHLNKLTASENIREKLLEKIINERKKAMKKAEEKNNATLFTAHSQVLQSSSQKQSKLSTFLSGRYVKSPYTYKIVKSPEKTLSNNLRKLFDNAKTKAKEKIKKPKNTSFEVFLKTSACASENQFITFCKRNVYCESFEDVQYFKQICLLCFLYSHIIIS